MKLEKLKEKLSKIEEKINSHKTIITKLEEEKKEIESEIESKELAELKAILDKNKYSIEDAKKLFIKNV